MTSDPLALDAATMRALGYRTVDLLVDRLLDPSTPPIRRAAPSELRPRLAGPPPAAGEPFDAILEQLERDVLRFTSRGDHPGFLAFVPFSGTWPGALGDLVASACNVYAGSWMESAGPSQVELEVLGWFRDWIDYPTGAAGVLVSGGSAANMTALACARETLAGPMSTDLVVYVSDQAHSSVARAARALGFRPEQVRVLPVDDDLRLDPSTLAAAMDADVRRGRRPLFVSASAGATNTGAVDPLPELAAVCRERVWLHADAAYGGFAVLTERGRVALGGLELADSVTLDPHKWLHQPYECGCLLVRDGRHLRAAFAITPDYLRDAAAADGEVNFADLGLQLTREWRALKVWLSVRYFGVDAFRAAINRSLDVAALARERVERSDRLELAAPPSLGIVCFRRRVADVPDEAERERVHRGLAAALERSGIGLVSTTRLRGEHVLRICVLGHATGPAHVERVLEFLEQAEPDAVVDGRPPYARDPDVRIGWLARPEADATAMRRIPLFRALSDEEAARVAEQAEPAEAVTGETVVEQWSASRDFFVLLEGTVDVLVEGVRVRELGPGDFFGELAALDWGAGYGYPRLASVVATSPLRLLVFRDGALNELVRTLPSVEREIRAAVRERLGRR
ncbi:MAG TPA: aminotransferase class V-fold PLP-dependent enzyme [Gaiellaceae bacterium]|nr:aminotransferase class V-fold PLP-dependent enzyme [Gaiellaceae bacterium]